MMLFIVGISLLAVANPNTNTNKEYRCCTDMVLRNALYLPHNINIDIECHNFSADTFAEDPYRLFQDLESEGFGLLSSINMACAAALGSSFDFDSVSGSYVGYDLLVDYEHESDADYWQNCLVLKV